MSLVRCSHAFSEVLKGTGFGLELSVTEVLGALGSDTEGNSLGEGSVAEEGAVLLSVTAVDSDFLGALLEALLDELRRELDDHGVVVDIASGRLAQGPGFLVFDENSGVRHNLEGGGVDLVHLVLAEHTETWVLHVFTPFFISVHPLDEQDKLINHYQLYKYD